VSDLKPRLLLPTLLAAALGGCGALPSVSTSDFGLFKAGDVLHSDDYNYFYRRDANTSGAVSPTDLVGPDGRCAFSAAPAPALSPATPATVAPEPVAQTAPTAPSSDPINPRSNQALYFTAGPETGRAAPAPNTLPPQVRSGPSGIALQMTECQVVSVAGYTDRVEIGSDRGQRSVTLTYLTGERPGIYRFINGRLASMDRVAEPEQPKKPAKKPTKTAKAKKAAPAQ
jgi:hypothetical protein